MPRQRRPREIELFADLARRHVLLSEESQDFTSSRIAQGIEGFIHCCLRCPVLVVTFGISPTTEIVSEAYVMSMRFFAISEIFRRQAHRAVGARWDLESDGKLFSP